MAPCVIEDERWRMTAFSFQWGTKSRSKRSRPSPYADCALTTNKEYSLVNTGIPCAYNYLKAPQAFKASAVAITCPLMTYMEESCEDGP